MDDREIVQWDKRLTDQAKRGWDNYRHLHIDLSVARIDQSYLIAGEYLYVEESSSAAALAKIKLNRNNNDALDLEKGVKIETVFIEIFITNEALENEWLDLVFGINFKYKKKIDAVGEGFAWVYMSSDQAIQPSVTTKINLDTTVIDRQNEFTFTGSPYDAAQAFIAKKSGDYLINLHFRLHNIASGKFINYKVYVNHVALYWFETIFYCQHYPTFLMTITLPLLKDDYLEFYVYHNDTVARVLLGQSHYNRAQIYRLR